MFAIWLLALAGCATGPTHAQLDELMVSVRALRADNARLESRLERLEQQAVLSKAPRAEVRPAPPPSLAVESSADALPALTVVKLKPRRGAVPRLDTQVEVVEPASEPPPLAEEAAAEAVDLAMAEAQYERALDSLKTGNAEGGVEAMQRFVVEWPRHPKADNALYFAGVGLMSAESWSEAASSFRRVVAEYPAGDAVIDAMLKLADCQVKLQAPEEARRTWAAIVRNFPGTAAASQAQARLTSHAALSAASP